MITIYPDADEMRRYEMRRALTAADAAGFDQYQFLVKTAPDSFGRYSPGMKLSLS